MACTADVGATINIIVVYIIISTVKVLSIRLNVPGMVSMLRVTCVVSQAVAGTKSFPGLSGAKGFSNINGAYTSGL